MFIKCVFDGLLVTFFSSVGVGGSVFLGSCTEGVPSSSPNLDTISEQYRKIPKISPGAYIFQRPFLRGLFLEGLIYGGKFAFQNRLG